MVHNITIYLSFLSTKEKTHANKICNALLLGDM